MERREWAACAGMLASFYPDSFKMDDMGHVDSWFWALGHLDGEAVKNAIIHMARTQKAFPSVADICALAAPPEIEADEAWAEVLKFANSAHVLTRVIVAGVEEQWQWSDPLIPRVLQSFQNGREIAMASDDRLSTIRAQFRKDYEAAKKRQARNEALGTSDHKRLGTTQKQNQLGVQVLNGGLEQIGRAL